MEACLFLEGKKGQALVLTLASLLWVKPLRLYCILKLSHYNLDIAIASMWLEID